MLDVPGPVWAGEFAVHGGSHNTYNTMVMGYLCRTVEELRVSSPYRTGMSRRVECFSTFLALDVGFDVRGLKVISEPCRDLHPSLIVRLVSPNLYLKPAPEHATQLCVDLGLIKVSEQICKGYSNFLRAAKPS
jgi:hypothetical protein